MVSNIKLTNKPNQTFKTTIPGDTRNLSFKLFISYNRQAGYWVLSIYDTTNNPIIANIPMLAGYDLLGQYQYLNIGSIYILNVGDQTQSDPNETNIANFVLAWKLV
jgi:hypothetical protein